MKTLVCLPTYNERESIVEMIERIRALGLDLIVVDQHSTDGTIALAERLGTPVHQRTGQGKGAGVQKAVALAAAQGCDVLVLIDCDLTYQPESIPELLSRMDGAEMVVGARDFGAIHWSHRLVNYLHTGMINWLFGARLRDINSGLRVLRVRAFQRLLDADGFDIEAQITTRALRSRFRVLEVPVAYLRRAGRSKIRARDTWTICRTILRERWS